MAVPFWLGSMSRTIPCSLPGMNRFPGCHPNVDVASAFVMMSIFSASSAARNRTTCFAFSDVTVHPRSASVVIPLAVNIVDRGKMALCQVPSLLNAISIFSSPDSMLLRRWVNMIGVLQTIFGVYCFSSMWLIPLSEYIQLSGCLKFTGAPWIASGISSGASRSIFSAFWISFRIFFCASSFPNFT